MTFVESEAVVLCAQDYGESDRIVTFFSMEWGLVRALAKGARRSQKRFVHAFEPNSVVQLGPSATAGSFLGGILPVAGRASGLAVGSSALGLCGPSRGNDLASQPGKPFEPGLLRSPSRRAGKAGNRSGPRKRGGALSPARPEDPRGSAVPGRVLSMREEDRGGIAVEIVPGGGQVFLRRSQPCRQEGSIWTRGPPLCFTPCCRRLWKGSGDSV